MSSQIVHLVTGANRGIGLELVRQLSQKPNSVVVAAVRDPSNASELNALKGNVDVVQISNAVEEDTKKVAQYVKQKYGKVDYVVANAGLFLFEKSAEAIVENIREQATVNYINVFILFQELYPLLKAAGSSKFIGMSTAAGSIASLDQIPFPVAAYGASKAALNFFLKKAALESKEDGITIFPIHPGMVLSSEELGKQLDQWGARSMAISLETSVSGMLKVIDSVQIDDEVVHHAFDGSIIPW